MLINLVNELGLRVRNPLLIEIYSPRVVLCRNDLLPLQTIVPLLYGKQLSMIEHFILLLKGEFRSNIKGASKETTLPDTKLEQN